MMMNVVRGLLIVLLGCCAALPAQADVRAWLDREQIALGETATLNIETDAANAQAPDYAALRDDFELSGHSSRRSFERVNGRSVSRSLFAVALRPRRSGVIGIPSLTVAGEQTQPLTLTVTPANPAPASARAGDVVFIETELDDSAPYVQQSVGMVVRLYYAVPLISGQLDQAQPEGASLRKVGDDLQYTRELAGRRYTVVERRYQLIPERSGTLTIPGARFVGRGVGGFFDEWFGGGRGQALSASAAVRSLEVRPIPAHAPQPWLPLHGLQLRYVTTPQTATADQAATVVVQARADGASAAQLPELQLDAGGNAQVFAEPAQVDERFEDGRPQVTVTRRFSVVPAQAGALTIEGPAMDWWDVRDDRARTTRLPDLALQVTAGQGASATSSPGVAAVTRGDDAADAQDEGWIDLPWVQDAVRPWALATVGFALLWMLTLAWGLQRQPGKTAARESESPVVRGRQSSAALRRALETGDLGDIGEALCAMAEPQVADVQALHARIDDAAQREALDALQQARWGDGDPRRAREMLRAAFARGPKWRVAGESSNEPLPPLYPPSR